MDYTAELIPRILRDVDDGVLALDQRGRIIYTNPQSRRLLGLCDDDVGKTYAEVFFDDRKGGGNDAFHQMVLDAVYSKERAHYGSVAFLDQHNNKRYLRVTSSFLRSEETNEPVGVVLVMSDVTETEILRKKREDAAVVFTCVTASVCLYILVLATLDFLRINVPTSALTQVINGIVFLFSLVLYKKTSFSPDELGLKLINVKQTFGWAAVISVAVVVVMSAAKLLMMQISPDFFAADAPFWNWNLGAYAWISYVFTCIIQEFLARSMVYGSIKKLFDGKKSVMAAILLSSLLFGAVHIAHGFVYMTAGVVLLGSLGGLYEKQRNIWGVAIVHYVVGEAAACLGFIT